MWSYLPILQYDTTLSGHDDNQKLKGDILNYNLISCSAFRTKGAFKMQNSSSALLIVLRGLVKCIRELLVTCSKINKMGLVTPYFLIFLFSLTSHLILFHSFRSERTGMWGETGVPRENHLTHPLAELGLSHMWPVRGSYLHQTQR